jgi:hypothetical protein
MDAAERYRRSWLERPDEFWDDVLSPSMAASEQAVAEHVAHCPAEAILIVDNLTVAATMVGQWLVYDIAAMELPPAEVVVLVASNTYNAVKNVFHAMARQLGPATKLVIETVDIPFPLRSSLEVIDCYKTKLASIAAVSAKAEAKAEADTMFQEIDVDGE